MQIYIVGATRSAGVTEFERYALNSGCDLRVAFMNGNSLVLDARTSGIVLFDEGNSESLVWLKGIRDQARYLSIPIIAVTSAQRGAQEDFLKAGATAVFDPTWPVQAILREVSIRDAAEPLLDELRKTLLEPFNTATLTTFREMANMELRLRSIYKKRRHKIFGDISAVIGLISSGEGAMVISLPQQTADRVAERVLMGVTDQVNEDMLRDCVGEIANVIAGHARGALARTEFGFDISTPTVISGHGHQIRHKPGVPCLVSVFSSDVGELALQVCLGN